MLCYEVVNSGVYNIRGRMFLRGETVRACTFAFWYHGYQLKSLVSFSRWLTIKCIFEGFEILFGIFAKVSENELKDI